MIRCYFARNCPIAAPALAAPTLAMSSSSCGVLPLTPMAADDFAFKLNGNTALQRRRTGQGQRSYATITDLIFEHLAWAAENRRGARFANADFHTGDLCIVKPFEEQQMTAVVNDNNHHRCAAFFSLRLPLPRRSSSQLQESELSSPVIALSR